jgi:hypothetical protein
LRREQKVWSEVLLAVPPTLLTIANEVIESAGRLLVCHLSNHWLPKA